VTVHTQFANVTLVIFPTSLLILLFS